jgi:superfamily II DNA or RNA helicase
MEFKQIHLPESCEYRVGTFNEPINFFIDVLPYAIKFDLLLGYFSSSAISTLSLGFASFIYNGGKMRLIINQFLSQQDKEAIIKGLTKDSDSFYSNNLILNDIERLTSELDDYGTHFFNCISYLISVGRIEFLAVKPKNKKGISHYKSGLFSDGKNEIKFKSSCNFTSYGLLENLEELEIKRGWGFENEKSSIIEYKDYFNSIFNRKVDFVEYLKIEDVETIIQNNFGNKEINELLIQEEKLIKEKQNLLKNPTIEKKLVELEKRIKIIIETPKFPYTEGPRDYQLEAYEKWKQNDYKGIFAMATGTGKTITSLNCLLNLYTESRSYKAIILVPTIALLDQWKKECLKFNFRNIITISSKEKWNEQLAFFITANKFISSSFIVIVTYASFVRSKFQSHFKLLPSDTLLIADEVHNMGAPQISKILSKIHINKRIGLSATPSRKYDIVGNNVIEDFFYDKTPYVYSYSMKEALDIGWLCKYTYHPHIVYLDEDELKEYIEISKQLLKYINPETNAYKEVPEVEMLLLARKRIIHKARNKKSTFKSILKDEFKKRGNLKFTLVYVPEGKDPDYTKSDEYIENEYEVKLINDYTRFVREADDTVLVKQYTAKTLNRNEVIKNFEFGKIHVLTSMKCLDEGVDVPRSELAIFCASTGNPRQFIQRRGRVLRTHNDKINAVIHDLVVVPQINRKESYYEMERNLLKKEIERVVDFSELSMNKIDTYEVLQEILDYYNLNLNDFKNE